METKTPPICPEASTVGNGKMTIFTKGFLFPVNLIDALNGPGFVRPSSLRSKFMVYFSAS